MTAKVTAKKAAPKRPATRATARPALPPAPDEEVEGLEVGADGAEVLRVPDDGDVPELERIPMFYIGDREFTVLKDPPVSIGLEALHIIARGGGGMIAQTMADDYMMTEMLGEEGYAVYRQSPKLTREQRLWVKMRVTQLAMGALEDPKS